MDGDTLLKLFKLLPTKQKIDDLDYLFDFELADEKGGLVCRLFLGFRVYRYAYIEPFVIELNGKDVSINCVFDKSAFLEQMTDYEQKLLLLTIEEKARDYLHLS